MPAAASRLEPGAEHDGLPHALFDRPPRRLLGEAAPRRDEYAQPAPRRTFPGLGEHRFGIFAENGQRQRIGENAPALENLMRSAVAGGAERGARELARQHGERLAREGRIVDRGDRLGRADAKIPW
jgi:hypothetical protein